MLFGTFNLAGCGASYFVMGPPRIFFTMLNGTQWPGMFASTGLAINIRGSFLGSGHSHEILVMSIVMAMVNTNRMLSDGTENINARCSY